jgi:membrane-associated HD superfamily phosphohydrolase
MALDALLSVLAEGSVLAILVAVVLMWKRQDDQRHADEIKKLSERYADEKQALAERFAAEVAAYTKTLSELRLDQAERERHNTDMLLDTLAKVTVTLEENTRAIADSAETIKVAAKITDAFVKKASNGNSTKN